MLAKCTGKHLRQRLYFNKVTGLRLWHKCFLLNLAKFLRASFLRNTSGRMLLVLAFEKQPPEVVLKILQNLQENTCGLWNFQEYHFYRTSLDDYFWLFPATLLKWSTANSVWKTSDKYSLSRNSNPRSTVQVHHFFLGSINFQFIFSLVYTVYYQKPSPEWRCYVKKGFLKISYIL